MLAVYRPNQVIQGFEQAQPNLTRQPCNLNRPPWQSLATELQISVGGLRCSAVHIFVLTRVATSLECHLRNYSPTRIAPKAFQVPGVPLATHTQPMPPPAVGCAFHTMSPRFHIPDAGAAVSY